MKYFTKKWYMDCQKTGLYFGLRSSKEAEEYSEAYYDKLYSIELKKRIRLMKKVNNTHPDSIFPREISFSPDCGLSDEEIAEINRNAQEKYELALEQYKNRPPFDKNIVTAEFAEIQAFRCMEFKELLPENIIKDIPDLRVFALGKAPSKVIKALKKYCNKLRSETNNVSTDYWSYYKTIESCLSEEIKKDFKMHDSQVISVQRNHDSLEIQLEPCFTRVKRIKFVHPDII